MSSKSSVQPVRPPSIPSEPEGGPDAAAAEWRGRGDKCHQSCAQQPGPVFPVGKADDVEEVAENDELICAPCGEEEQADVSSCLPSVYQPTRSEYLDHCVSHFRFVLGASTASVADASSRTAA